MLASLPVLSACVAESLDAAPAATPTFASDAACAGTTFVRLRPMAISTMPMMASTRPSTPSMIGTRKVPVVSSST